MIIDGVKLTQIRVWRGLTRAELSTITGIEIVKITRYERVTGAIVPNEHLDLLLEALNINIKNIER